MRRSAGHVDGERKTMAVADRHDFAALTASSRADVVAPFFAELKLASMKRFGEIEFAAESRDPRHTTSLKPRPSDQLTANSCQL